MDIPQHITNELTNYSELHLWELLVDITDSQYEATLFCGTDCSIACDDWINTLSKLDLIEFIKYLLDLIKDKL